MYVLKKNNNSPAENSKFQGVENDEEDGNLYYPKEKLFKHC